MAQPPLQKWLGHFLLHRPQRELGMQSVIQETADSHRPHGTVFDPREDSQLLVSCAIRFPW